MTNRNIIPAALCTALSLILVACNHFPGDLETNARLDEMVQKLDRSLANQAMVDERLVVQQSQLDAQGEQLQGLSQELGRALEEPAPHTCPEIAECPAQELDSGKVIVGEFEEVWLSELEISLTARMDTGALTSSLYVNDIELFERDGKSWVRFAILDPRLNEPTTVERKLRRTVSVVQTDTNEPRRRPVVRMGVVIGNVTESAEFILRERMHRKYQALIGRSIIRDVMVVDVSRKHMLPHSLSEQSHSEQATAGVE